MEETKTLTCQYQVACPSQRDGLCDMLRGFGGFENKPHQCSKVAAAGWSPDASGILCCLRPWDQQFLPPPTFALKIPHPVLGDAYKFPDGPTW